MPLSAYGNRNLRKHENGVRKVSESRLFLSEKRKYIGQKGGFLLPLLSAV